MPKHTKKSKNKGRTNKSIGLRYKNEGNNTGEEYGHVRAIRGNCRFQVELLNGDCCEVELAGRLKKRCKIKLEDLVLIEPTDDGARGHWRIVARYTKDQKKTLQKEGQLLIETDVKVEEKVFEFEGEDEIDTSKGIVNIDEDFIDFI